MESHRKDKLIYVFQDILDNEDIKVAFLFYKMLDRPQKITIDKYLEKIGAKTHDLGNDISVHLTYYYFKNNHIKTK